MVSAVVAEKWHLRLKTCWKRPTEHSNGLSPICKHTSHFLITRLFLAERGCVCVCGVCDSNMMYNDDQERLNQPYFSFHSKHRQWIIIILLSEEWIGKMADRAQARTNPLMWNENTHTASFELKNKSDFSFRFGLLLEVRTQRCISNLSILNARPLFQGEKATDCQLLAFELKFCAEHIYTNPKHSDFRAAQRWANDDMLNFHFILFIRCLGSALAQRKKSGDLCENPHVNVECEHKKSPLFRARKMFVQCAQNANAFPSLRSIDFLECARSASTCKPEWWRRKTLAHLQVHWLHATRTEEKMQQKWANILKTKLWTQNENQSPWDIVFALDMCEWDSGMH